MALLAVLFAAVRASERVADVGGLYILLRDEVVPRTNSSFVLAICSHLLFLLNNIVFSCGCTDKKKRNILSNVCQIIFLFPPLDSGASNQPITFLSIGKDAS